MKKRMFSLALATILLITFVPAVTATNSKVTTLVEPIIEYAVVYDFYEITVR